MQAAYLTLVQKSSEHHHKSTLELLHLNAMNTLPLFLTMSLLLGEPASVSASLLTEDLSFYVVFVILIRKFKMKSWVTYLGYLVDDLHWSRWVLSGDVVGQCCLRTYVASV